MFSLPEKAFNGKSLLANEKLLSSNFCNYKDNKFQVKLKQKPLVYKGLIILMTLMLTVSQLLFASAEEYVANNTNITHHNSEASSNLANALSHDLSSINPSYVNPHEDMAQVLSSLMSSNLNLNSIIHSVNASSLVHDVLINVANHSLEITNNSILTPAEAVALKEVLTDNSQTLILNSLGQAIGGSLTVSDLGSHLITLDLPLGVTLYDNASNLNFTGNLANFGDIIVTGSHTSIEANILFNGSSGQINAYNTLSLNTNALINFGSISSSNNFNIGSSVIYNTGLLASVNDNIAITTYGNSFITGSVSGNIEALNGSINITDLASSNASNNTLNFALGNYLSQSLNINSNSASIQGVVGNVSGNENFVSENGVSFATSSKDMIIGNANIHGDPTFVNTLGDITINGAVTTNGNNLAIIASGNINVATNSAASISTVGTTANGGNLTMIAGVGSNLTGGSVNSTTIPTNENPATSTVTVVLGTTTSNSGGNIDLVTNNTLANNSFVINTNGNGTGNFNGGNVTLFAQSNGTTGGEILTSNGSTSYGIETGGVSTGTNGNVTIISTANNGTSTPGTGIEIGAINTAGGSGTGGNVSLYTANANSQTVTFDTTGTIGSGQTITANTASLTPANIILNGSITAPQVTGDGNLTINSGAGISTGNNILTGATLTVNAQSGNFGSAPANVLTDIGVLTITLNSTTGGNAYVTNTNSNLTLDASSVPSEFSLVMTNLTTGSININGSLTIGTNSGSGIINLQASGSGNITQANSNNEITAGLVNLATAGGNIGKNGYNPIFLDAAAFSVSTGTTVTTASAYLSDSYTGILNISNTNIVLPATGTFYLVDTNQISGSGINLNGSLTVGTVTSGSSVYLTTFGYGTITESSTTDILTAQNIFITSQSGNIGENAPTGYFSIDASSLTINSSAGAFITDSNSLTLNASSVENLYLSVTGNLTQAANSNLVIDEFLTMTATANLSVGSMLSADGNIELVSVNGILTVYNNSLIEANTGVGAPFSEISLIAQSTTTGGINIGSNVNIISSSIPQPSNNNEIYLVVGNIPATGTNTTPPANVTTQGNAKVYFGANSILASSPNNNITANTYNVVFNNGGSSTTPITLGGNDNIEANSQISLTSLDLTNSTVTSDIIAMQKSGIIGGTLQVNTSGIAIGGNIILNGLNDNLTAMTAEVIPSNVTLTLENFTAANAINIELSTLSTNEKVIINGNEQFITTIAVTASNGSINVYNGGNLPSTNLLMDVGSSGKITSDGGLSLLVDGNSEYLGSITTNNNLVISTLIFTSNGSITLGGNIDSYHGSISVISYGTGGISEASVNKAILTAPSIILQSDLGNIGSSSQALLTQSANLNVSSGGNVYLQNTGSVTLGSLTNMVTAGYNDTFSLSTQSNSSGNGEIVIGGNIIVLGSASTINLAATSSGTGTGGIQEASNNAGTLTANTVNLTGTGNGTGSASAQDIGSLSYINTQTAFLNIFGNGNVYVNNTGSFTLGNSTSTLTAGNNDTFNITASADTYGNGGITLGGNISVTGVNANISLYSTSLGNGSGGIQELNTNAGTLTANLVNLNDIGTGTGNSTAENIGSLSQNILTNSSNLTVNTTGSAFINNTGSVTLGNSNVGNVVGNLFNLTTTANASGNGEIFIATSSLINSSGSINLTATSSGTGTGGIQEASSSAGTISANTINLRDTGNGTGSSNAQDIGANGLYNLATSTLNLSVNTSGNDFISNTGSVTILNSSIGNNKTFSLSTIQDGNGNTEIILASNINVTGSLGSIILNSGDSYSQGGIQESATNPGTLTANSITLNDTSAEQGNSSSSNDIGSSISNISTNTANLTVNTVNNYIAYASAYVSDSSAVNLNSSIIGGNFVLNDSSSITMASSANLVAGNNVNIIANTGLSIGSVAAINGNISLVANSGNFNVANNALIQASFGTITLQEVSTTNGSINIGTNVTITGENKIAPSGNNEIFIVVGALPTTGNNTTAPSNANVNITNSGIAYFGTNSIIANSPVNNVNVNGLNVIFNNAGNAATPIILSGSDTINANLQTTLTSLDLTNSTVTSNILALQSSGVLGGTLIVNGSGVATGGNIIINSNKVNLANLTAENIPTSVTVQLNNFQIINQVGIDITSSSTTKQVLINGTEEFLTTGSTSNANINIINNVGVSTAILNIGSTGNLTSDGTMTTIIPGNIQISGQLTALNNLNITVPSSSSYGNLTTTGNVISTNGTVNIDLGSIGSITQTIGSTALITGNAINLTNSNGIIGSGAQPISIDTTNLSVLNAGNNVQLNNTNTATLNINTSSFTNAAVFTIISAGNININGSVSDGLDSGSGSIILTANGLGNITTTSGNNSDQLIAGSITLTTNGGNIGSFSQGVLIDANKVSLTTGTSTGNAYVVDSSANNIAIDKAIVGAASIDTFALSGVNSSTTSILTASGISINAPNVIITSQYGNIGTSATSVLNLNTNNSANASNITLSAVNGNVYATDSASGLINFRSVTAYGQALNNAASLNNTGVFLFNDTSSTQYASFVTPTGSIVNGNSVSLSTANGYIGTNSLNFNVNTSNLSVASNTNVFINDNSSSVNLNQATIGSSYVLSLINTGSININTAIVTGTSTDSGAFTLSANGNITQGSSVDSITSGDVTFTAVNGSIITQAAISTNNLNLTTTGAGNITINSNVGLANTGLDIINANGTGYITTGSGGLIIGDGLSLVSNGGEIGFGVGGLQPLNTQANNIVFSAGLSVGILNTSANLNVGNSGSGANVYIETTGNMTGSGSITAPVIGLYSFGGSSGIGSSTSLMQINAHNIGLQSYGAGSSVYVNDTYTGSTIMQASQASLLGGIFKLNTAGPLTIYAQIDQGGVVTPGVVSAQIIAIQTQSGYGIYNDASIQANDFIFLTASQNGYIAEPVTGALMIAPNIALVSGGGAIGAGGRLLLNSANVAASTQGLNNFVNIYDEATNSGIVGGQSGSSFTFNTNGNINIMGGIGTGAGSKANGGAINISGNGIINIGTTAGINMTTNNGPIVVQDNNSTAGAINIAKNSYVYTTTPVNTAGYVVFNIGSYNQVNTSNPNPSSITVQTSGGANVYFGNNGITATSSGNILNAKGQDIVFNTGSLAGSAITLGGNVSITADPPVLSTPPAILLNNNSLVTENGSVNSLNASNLNSVNTQGFSNVLDNNQAGMNLNNSLNSPNNEMDYLTNISADSEIVENTSLVMPIAYCTKVGADPMTNLADKSLADNQNIANACGSSLNQRSRSKVIGLTLTNATNACLTQGSVIIYASHNMVIKLGSVKPLTLNLKRGAMVLAITNGNIVSVYNLHDNSQDSVKLIISQNNEIIKLTPGRHVSVALANSCVDFAYINQVRKIGYRCIKTNTSNGIATYISDFSIPSAISAIKPLKAMIRSKDKAVLALANQLLKTSVVVTQSTSGNGAYEQIAKPKLTAMR